MNIKRDIDKVLRYSFVLEHLLQTVTPDGHGNVLSSIIVSTSIPAALFVCCVICVIFVMTVFISSILISPVCVSISVMTLLTDCSAN